MTDELQAFIQAELKKESADRFFKNARDFLLSQSGYTADMLRRIEIDGTPAPIVLDSLGNRVSSEPKLRTEFMTSYSPAPPPLTPEKIRAAAASMRATVGIELQPTDTVLFTVTNEPALPWPTPYRSLDAGFRTSSEEWKQSVEERFARRSGAELLRGATWPRAGK